MKKFYLWFMIFACLSFPVFAQENQVEKMVNATLDAKDFNEKSKNIQDIEVNFCDNYDSKSIKYEMSFWKKQDICLNLFNGSDSDVVVNLWFVDGMLTNDQRKNRACGNADDIDVFGQYVTGYNAKILLKKDETKTEYAKIIYPENIIISGNNIEWCLVYSLSADNESWKINQWFDIVVRKAKFISLNIKKVSLFDSRYLSWFVIVLVMLILLLYISKFHKKISKWK